MDKVRPLLARKDEIEAQLRELDQALQSHGVSFQDPLVDSEGFPRADIDVGAVRHIRIKVVALRNDLKQVMAEIEQALHTLHQATRTVLTPEQQAELEAAPVFASVGQVFRNSPAELAGLCTGDRLIKFGRANHTNHNQLKLLATIVTESLNQPLQVFVERPNASMRFLQLELTPAPWEGKGFLG